MLPSFEPRTLSHVPNSAFTLATCAATSLRAPAAWLIATISGDLWRMELTCAKMSQLVAELVEQHVASVKAL